MMRKLPLMVAGICGFMASGLVMADYPELTGGRNAVTMVDCSLLANDIELVLSNNVVGGVACNTATAVVALSACHTTGQTASRSAVVTLNDDGSVKCTVAGDETCVETVTGSSFPTASTAQGTVSNQFPGQACTAAQAVTVAGTQAPNPPANP